MTHLQSRFTAGVSSFIIGLSAWALGVPGFWSWIGMMVLYVVLFMTMTRYNRD